MRGLCGMNISERVPCGRLISARAFQGGGGGSGQWP
jgi:hypothetical protein